MASDIATSITPRRSRHFCPASLEFFNLLFVLQNKFEPLVVQWSSNSKSFYSNSFRFKRKCTAGLFNIYVISLLVGFGSCTIVLINRTKIPNITASLVITSIFVCACCLLLVASETILILHSNSIVDGFRSFGTFIQGLSRNAPNMRINSPLHCPFRAKCGAQFWRRVSNILVMCQVVLMMIILLQPVPIYTKQDPFHITIPMIRIGIPILTGTSMGAVLYEVVIITNLCERSMSAVCVLCDKVSLPR